ncbi:MAG: von Willebrand factor type A domain-containing protein, partial [Roseimicrobium sp.]
MSTGDPATNVITNSVLTDGSVPILGEIPIAGRAFQSTGGIVKSGAGTLALGNSTAMPQPTSVPTGAEPFAPGFAMGVFGGGVLPESEKNDPLSPQGNTSLSMATASTSANGSSIAPVATRGGNISFKNGNIAGTGATTPPANDDFALADAAKAAPKMTSVAGTVLDAPADLAAIASTTPTPAPTAKPMEAKPAAPSRAVTLARVTDNTPEAAGAVPASPAAAAPMAGVAGAAAAPAATTAAPVVGDPYIALNEPKKRVMQESLVRDEDESEVLQVTRDKQLKELKQLQDGAERSRTKLMRSAGGETYTPIYENPFLQVAQQPLSTFSIDVDTASYANVRRFLNNGQRPPADAVRLEELINYFPYSYEPPAEDGAPFSVTVDMAEAPWQPMHRLARIALKGREIRKERGAANFVFLVDVSGSMDEPDKLPLVKQSLRMLTEQIKDTDRVAIVTYAGESGVALTSTPGSQRKKIQNAIEKLGAGGSTNGAGGIRMAYQQATENFVQEGVNRVILCTDGDFNVGLSSPEELEKLIAEKAKSRVFLSVLGYGTGNLKDRTMETLADKGNGNYAYIDSLSEARKVLVDQMNATLVTIAKDVKIQVEFNPTQVAAYRLLGYENRALAKEDFNNDRKDAGEIGAGHTVTALYEIVPAGARLTSPDGRPMVDNLKYAPQPAAPAVAATPAPGGGSPSKETMTVKLRYKQPEGDKSQLIEVPVIDKEQTMANAPRDFVFAASVTGFGMLLRNSQYSSELTWDMVRDMAIRGKGEDALGYRGEFLQLIDKARGLTEGRE